MLDSLQAKAVFLLFRGGLTTAEIGRVLRVPEATVSNLLAVARDAIHADRRATE